MDSKTPPKNSSSLSSLLGPGFRFHPTDEELVQFYLRRKVIGKSFRFDAITDVDVYKTEPWDLPYMSKLKTRDLEWYFFSFLDKKYGNGARTNRATGKGYWKTTGKDRAVYHRKQVVGMKKTLVYHSGRAPKGQRTNWVMHEYRLIGSELETGGVAQDAFVLCRIFQKSGSGPKNGEQYGAPFVDEEWDNDDALDLVPQHDATAEIDFGDNVCFNSDELQQIPGSDVLSNVALPVSSQSADGSHVGEATSFGSTQDHLVSAGAYHCESTMCYQQNVQNSPASFDMDVTPVKKDCIGECSKSGNSDDFNFLLNDPFLDSFDYFPNADEGFIEANDLAKPFETSNAFDMLEEYLDASDDSSFCLACDPEMLFGSDDLFSNQTLLPHTDMGNGSEQAILPMGQLINDINSDAAIPPDKPGLTEYQSDFQYPFIKKASGMLGNVQAPPAFAAEFPPKDAILRLNSVARPRKSVDVSADTVQIRNSDVSGKGTKQSPRKHENFKLVLCFGFWRGDGGSSSVFPGKTLSATYRGWLCLSVFWILILSMGFRIGTYIGFK